MTEALILGPLVAIGLTFLWMHARKIHTNKNFSNVIVNDWRKATYYPGKGKNGHITPTLAHEIYERDDWECQYPGCGVTVTEGIANTFLEHVKGIAGAEPGNINHKYVSDHYGGPAIPENLEVMCQRHNIKRGKKIPRAALPWLAGRGETICLDRNDLLN